MVFRMARLFSFASSVSLQCEHAPATSILGAGEFIMKRLSISLLALGLAGASLSAAAQSYDDGYTRQAPGQYSAGTDSYDDEARVIRVDPVLEEGYRTVTNASQRCYERSSAGYYDNRGYRNDGDYRNGYDYGGRRVSGSEAGRNVATIAGGVIGAVLGSKVGGGSGTYAATAVGSMLGGMAGREIYEQRQQNRYVQGGTVRVCDPVPVRDGYNGSYNGGYAGNTSAYDVTYEYNGRRYTRRMSYHPGDRVRVRVDVSPQ